MQETITVKLWTALYNKCLEITNIPKIWRESTVKVVYIGKGSQNAPDSFRGSTLECTPFMILNNILLGKIHDRVMTVIPREQYGFIPGRSTTQAVGQVLQYISEALSKPKGHAYAIFIDYKQAFDGVNRNRVLEKLHPVLGAESQIFKFIIFNVLTHDVVQRIQTEEVRMWLYSNDMILNKTTNCKSGARKITLS